METVVLVGCGKSKLPHAAPAKDLYTGLLFKKARAYAERVGDDWAILSAKHFLVMPQEVIEPYDRKLQLGGLHKDYRRQWIMNTNWMIRSAWETWKNQVRFICLASKEYAQCFNSPLLSRDMKIEAEFPLEGMGIGQRLRFLTHGSDGARNNARNAESVPGVAPVASVSHEKPKASREIPAPVKGPTACGVSQPESGVRTKRSGCPNLEPATGLAVKLPNRWDALNGLS